MTKTASAWIAIDHRLNGDPGITPYALILNGQRSSYEAIAAEDWVLILSASGDTPRRRRAQRCAPDRDEWFDMGHPVEVQLRDLKI